MHVSFHKFKKYRTSLPYRTNMHTYTKTHTHTLYIYIYIYIYIYACTCIRTNVIHVCHICMLCLCSFLWVCIFHKLKKIFFSKYATNQLVDTYISMRMCFCVSECMCVFVSVYMCKTCWRNIVFLISDKTLNIFINVINDYTIKAHNEINSFHCWIFSKYG